ncbi:hypothetical protein OHR68_12930 [Spirillospora sp. NBC_00431]
MTVAAWSDMVSSANRVVVRSSSSETAAKRFVKGSGVDPGIVRIVRSTTLPRPLHALVGGVRYWTFQYGCSPTFSVKGG